MKRWTYPLAPVAGAVPTALVAALVSSIWATAPAAAAPPVYRIEIVEKGKSVRPTDAYAITNNGIIAGRARYFEGGGTAFIFKDGKTSRLDNPSLRFSIAYSVNSRGEAAGYSDHDAYLWDSSGLPTNLGALIDCDDTYQGSTATSINEAGAVVGIYTCSKANVYENGGFIFYNAVMSKLPDFGGGNTFPTGINKFGQVAGASEYPPDNGQRRMHAFSWHNGVMTDIGTLPGDAESEATGLNDLGHIIGRSNAPDGHPESFVYVNGTMYVLPRCAGNRVVTEAINNKGQIVGSYPLKRYEAALIQDGRCYTLSTLLDASGAGWWDLRAYDINDDGVIVGTGRLDNKQRAFVATPVKLLSQRPATP